MPPDSNGKTSVKVPADAGHDVISLRGDVISSRSQTPVQSADSYDAATFESDSHAGSTHLNTAASNGMLCIGGGSSLQQFFACEKYSYSQKQF